jgi:hypothetical protein
MIKMSDEFSAGVQILLKRMESNPNEFTGEHGKWSSIRNAVFAYKEHNDHSAWLRGLTKAEIDALHEKLSTLYRPVLDEWVMKNVLDEPEEEQRNMAQGRGFSKSFSDPRLYQNALQPGTMLTVAGSGGGGSGQVQIKPESVMSKIKKELGL